MGSDGRILINPSILNANFDDLENEISKVSAVSDAIHLDIMDNKFVPNFTFNLERAIEIINFSKLPIDAHLMIEDPDNIAPKYAQAGCDSVSFHFEAVKNCRQTIADKIQYRRVQQLQRRTSGVSATNLAEVVTPKPSQEHWIPLSERELSGVTLLPKGTAQARAEWQPNEVPLPTYVNAPKAVTAKRVIDLTEPGKWSEEQQRLEREALAAAAPSQDEIFDQQLAEEAVRRLRDSRAANQ